VTRGMQQTALFVYGTLCTGEDNAGLLAGLPVQEARVRGHLFRLPAGYPALVADSAGTWVRGELVTLDGEVRLGVLDHLEGVGQDLFQRVSLPVAVDGRTVVAWAYVMDRAQVRERTGVRVDHGDWRRLSVGRKRS